MCRTFPETAVDVERMVWKAGKSRRVGEFLIQILSPCLLPLHSGFICQPPHLCYLKPAALEQPVSVMQELCGKDLRKVEGKRKSDENLDSKLPMLGMYMSFEGPFHCLCHEHADVTLLRFGVNMM
jgi:hypothetical protein